jgi:MSHA pilin protein MshD
MLNNLKPQQRGASLIELIMFIVIITVALAGILLVTDTVTGRSADSLVRKQGRAIAESLLEEIQLQNFATPGGFGGPYTQANRASFDTVTNYDGFTTNGIFSVSNTSIAGLGSYKVTAVSVVPTALGSIAAANCYLITVTVKDTQGNDNTVFGYRTNY